MKYEAPTVQMVADPGGRVYELWFFADSGTYFWASGFEPRAEDRVYNVTAYPDHVAAAYLAGEVNPNDPEAAEPWVLHYRPESSCYFWGRTFETDGHVHDVTGVPEHEAMALAYGVADPRPGKKQPTARLLYAGTRVPAGGRFSTVLADMDFETYSESGYVYVAPCEKYPFGAFRGLPNATEKGLFAVGARVYAEHPSTEVLTMSYDLKDGKGKRRWKPGQGLPQDLFDHLAAGGLIETHNAMFERVIWTFVCQVKYGFPPLNPKQLRCSMAKARAFSMPGALANLGKVLNTSTQKDAEGKRLLDLFSKPQKPSKKAPALRVRPEDAPEDGAKLEAYCDTDIESEGDASRLIPDLIPQELDYWLADQEINFRGVGIDLESVRNCIAIVNQVLDVYGQESVALCGLRPSQLQKLKVWLSERGVNLDKMDADSIEDELKRTDLGADVRRVLELRALTGSASVKKVFAMLYHSNRDGRACDLFVYHGARTGRDTHADIQPGNLPKAGPKIRWCDAMPCRQPYAFDRASCPWCNASAAFSTETSPDPEVEAKGWCWEAVPAALAVIATQSVDVLEYYFGDAMLTISGVIRGMFISAPGKDLICSDYSSIEAVVTAVLAGEQWRLDAFERKDDIYLASASRITGHSMDWYRANGYKKHPDRQKIGKPAELGLGFGGYLPAWRQFDDSDTWTDDQVKELIMQWRDASPLIVEAWGGQTRGKPWKPSSYELFGLEGAAIAAIQNPGKRYTYRLISYEVVSDVLYAILPSGRRLSYHSPRLRSHKRKPDWPSQLEITFMTWNNNPKMGPLGWVRMKTFGGRLFENVVQAVARDIMAYAVVNLEKAGYPVVLRVHDELVSEVPEGVGTIEQFEAIMQTLPAWAKGWPIRAAGGWRAKRYRKDA